LSSLGSVYGASESSASTMAPMGTITAVAIAALLQVANAYQHLVFYGKQGWDNVEKVELKVTRGSADGFDPNKDFKEFTQIEWNPKNHDHFGYTLTTRAGDTVFVRLTQTGKAPVVSESVIPKFVENEDKHKEYTEFGDVKLFSLRENVRHMGVWKDVVTSLAAESDQSSSIVTKFKWTFNKVDKDHDGWHVLVMMDAVKNGADTVTLAYTSVGEKDKTTEKKIDQESKALFGGWSVVGKKGTLKVTLAGSVPVEVPLDECVFKSFPVKAGSETVNFIVMPFDTHAKFDKAWRTIMKGHGSSTPTHKYWKVDGSQWILAALEELNTVEQTKSVQTAGASETPISVAQAGTSEAGPNWTVIIIGCGVGALLVAAAYFFCCATPDEKDSSRSKTSSSDSNEGFMPAAPSMHGEAWPVESVKVLIPPTHETEITGVAKSNDV